MGQLGAQRWAQEVGAGPGILSWQALGGGGLVLVALSCIGGAVSLEAQEPR